MRSLAPAVGEVRRIAGAFRDELDTSPVGPVLVSGMLAEQLARLLAERAAPGAVITADVSRVTGSSVVVQVIAGDPSSEDEDVVRRAGRAGVPIVLVQLWPQAEWAKPFVLSPFVVECRAGEGFPVPEIAARIVEAVESAGRARQARPGARTQGRETRHHRGGGSSRHSRDAGGSSEAADHARAGAHAG